MTVGMKLLAVGFMLAAIIGSGCVAQSDEYCQAYPVSSNTSQDGLPYVESEEENQWCFYDPKDFTGRAACKVGYHCQSLSGNSPCRLCPHNKSGLKTYQPQRNYCPKCILCTDCEREGMEEVSECTIERNAVCQKRSSEPSGDNYDHTTEAVVENSRQSSMGPLSPSEKPKTQDEIEENPVTDVCNSELDQLRKQNSVLKVMVAVILVLLFTIILGFLIYKWRYLPKSSLSSGGENNQNSGHNIYSAAEMSPMMRDGAAAGVEPAVVEETSDGAAAGVEPAVVEETIEL